MLMVVFGAGASHDSLDVKLPTGGNPGWLIDEQFRPPLANQLFGSRELFADAISRFEKLHPIVPLLRHPGRNVETVLRELQEEADAYPERHRQLMAVRYYLHLVLWECGERWKGLSKGVTNYKALLDQIERWRPREEPVCLVTFNYDTLLEAALPTVGLNITALSHYVCEHPYKLFKLHGSVDWARATETRIETTGQTWDVVNEQISRATELVITDTFIRINDHPCGRLGNGLGLVPAIAIPVEKKAHFECPKEHLAELERLLPEVDKLLLIGWFGAEDHFLQLLQKALRSHHLVGQVVAQDADKAREIAVRLEEGLLSALHPRWEIAPGGFSDFVVNRRIGAILGPSFPGRSAAAGVPRIEASN